MSEDNSTVLSEGGQVDLRELAAEWYAGKTFSSDVMFKRLNRWGRLFRRFVPRDDIEVLDLGSGEGWTSLFFLNYLPLARVVAVGTTPEHADIFRENVQGFEDRLEILDMGGMAAVDTLLAQKRRFHVINIDASRSRDYVLALSLLAWQVLRKGGVLVWNDYVWGEGRPSEKRPHDAINWFLDMREQDVEVLDQGNQMIVRKLVP